MAFYYYIFLIMILFLLFLSIRFFILQKKSTQLKLFIEALQFENSGLFEEAVTTYETALNEGKKIKNHSTSLDNKIIDKLKVLHTIIEYKNNLRFMRKSLIENSPALIIDSI